MSDTMTSGFARHSTRVSASLRWLAGAALPPDTDGAPTLANRLAVFPLLFVPWLLLYEYVVALGPPRGAFETYLPGEINWPIVQWTELLYVSPYVLVAIAPLFATSNKALRRFLIAAAMAAIFIFTCFLTIPAIATPRPFFPQGLLGQMMMNDRMLDRNNGTAAFPSFHVVWAFLGATLWAHRMPRWRNVWLLWAACVSLSCVTTGMHSLLDIITGFLVFLVTYNFASIRQQLFRRKAVLVPVEPPPAAPDVWEQS